MVDSIVEFINSVPQWVQAVGVVVLAANGVTSMTPTKWDNQLMEGLSKVLNALAFNFGKNKNADA